MQNPTYAARLRYLDADDVDDAVVDYDDLEVYGPDDRKIGTVDGFIIDAEARRVNYVVIDSGGWFASNRFLLPIGHATLAPDRRSIRTDITKDALGRLPDYDPDRFREFTDDELRMFERNTVVACCPDEPLEDVSVSGWGYDRRRHYTQPDWWQSSRYPEARLRPIGSDGATTRVAVAPTTVSSSPGRSVTATPNRPASAERMPDRERELVHGQSLDTDPSPHLDGRAQPGDVLGIETGGERTGLGDTADEENKRRQTAERAAADDPPRQSER